MAGGRQIHAVAHVDARGLSGDEGEHRLGDAHVRVLLEGGVLDRPDDVETDLFGEDRLLHDLIQGSGIARAGRVRGLGFVDQREFHGRVPLRPDVVGDTAIDTTL